jgi:hypothetical protein
MHHLSAIVIFLVLSTPAFSQTIFDDPSGKQPVQQPTVPPEAPPAVTDSPVHPEGPLLPVPNAATLKTSMALLNNAYGADIRAAKTPDQKKAMVQKLLDAARNETEATRYALLTTARNLAAEAGDLKGCDAAMDGLEGSFIVDSAKERFEAYTTLARNVILSADVAQLGDDVTSVLRAAVGADRFDIAKLDAELGLRIARKSDDGDLEKRAAADAQLVRVTQEAYAGVAKSLAVLAQKPTDPDASLKVGQYRCFLKADWQHGLPMLALGSDAALKDLASREIAGVTAAEDQAKLGDGWWDVAEKLASPQKTLVQKHAVESYQTALGSLTGLSKLRTEKRIAEANAAEQAAGGSGTESVLVEALIDGSSELHIIPTGIYWVENGVAKPGMHDKIKYPTFVNGREWWPKWGKPAESRGDDTSQPLQLPIGSGELNYEIVSITEKRGEKGIADRDAVTLKKTADECVLSIPDGQIGAMWYVVRLSKNKMTVLKRQLAGKWSLASTHASYALNADGSTSDIQNGNTGTWGANAQGTAIEIRWKNDGWVDLYKSAGGKWVRFSSQNGILKSTNDVTPP